MSLKSSSPVGSARKKKRPSLLGRIMFTRQESHLALKEDFSFEEEARKNWVLAKSFSVVYKDVPRLASRTSVSTVNGRILHQGRFPPAPDAPPPMKAPTPPVDPSPVAAEVLAAPGPSHRRRSSAGDEATAAAFGALRRKSSTGDDGREVSDWTAVANLLLTLAVEFETPECNEKLRKVLDDVHGDDSKSSQATLLEKVVTECGLIGTRTHKVLQAIHQQIIFPSVYRIRMEVLDRLGEGFMDVRGTEGWQVLVEITPTGYVNVTHTRKEQTSEKEPGSELHYKIEWEMCMRFDPELKEMKAVRLKVSAVELHPDAPKELKDKVGALLIDGQLIL